MWNCLNAKSFAEHAAVLRRIEDSQRTLSEAGCCIRAGKAAPVVIRPSRPHFVSEADTSQQKQRRRCAIISAIMSNDNGIACRF